MASEASPIVLHTLGAIVFGIGALVVGKGLSQRGEGTEMAERERSDIAAVRSGDGLVEVSGTAEATEAGTLAAPIADTEALVVTDVVEEQRTQEKLEASSSNRTQQALVTIHEATRTRPFLVSDGTGTALVEVPAEAETPTETTAHKVGEGEAPPQAVRETLEALDGFEAAPEERRIYHQSVIEAGEEVYVVAEPTAPDDGWGGPDITLTGETAPEDVIVSSHSEEALVDAKQQTGNVTLAPGIIVALFGLFIFIIPFL